MLLLSPFSSLSNCQLPAEGTVRTESLLLVFALYLSLVFFLVGALHTPLLSLSLFFSLSVSISLSISLSLSRSFTLAHSRRSFACVCVSVRVRVRVCVCVRSFWSELSRPASGAGACSSESSRWPDAPHPVACDRPPRP